MENLHEKYVEDGFKRSEHSHGRAQILQSYLMQIVSDVVKTVKNKSEAQQNIIDKITSEITLIKNKNEELTTSITNKNSEKAENNQHLIELRRQKDALVNQINENLNDKRRLIDTLATKIGNVQESAQTKKKANISHKISIGVIIGLTILLWIFYSSAMHSAFIRDIQADFFEQFNSASTNAENQSTISGSATTLRAVINLNAIGDTWRKGGILGVLLLSVFSFLPLSAGFLIYIFKGQRQKLILVFISTLVFDILLAFKLVKEIHIASHRIGLDGYEKAWEFSFFYKEESFYMILSIGFVGYVLWGILLNYVLTEQDRYEPFKKEVTNRQKEIEKLQNEQIRLERDYEKKESDNRLKNQQLDNEIDKLRNIISDNEAKKGAKQQELDLVKSKIPIPKAELEGNIESFFAGWCKWIVQNLPTKDMSKENQAITDCQNAKDELLTKVYNSKEYFIIE